MRKILITALLLWWGSLYANDPSRITGQVADSDGNPLPYASVLLREDNTVGSLADHTGRFTMTLPPSEEPYTLCAVYTGYKPQDITVAGTVAEVGFRLEEDPMNINTVVVTGTRTPKLLKDVPVLTRVISSDEIRKVDATNIGDLLQAELPGVDFSYQMGQQPAINVQGFGGTSVLFLVDGERLAGESLDNVDYTRLNMDNVERVEIVKGAGSSLYGSNAIGGVINIITKQAAKPWAVNLNSRYGTHNAWRNGGSVLLNQGRFNSVTDFQHTAQDAAFLGRGFDENGTPSDTYLYSFRTYSVRERLMFRVSDKIDLVAKGGYFFRERHPPEDSYDRYRDWTYGLRMNYDIDPRNYLEIAYNYDQYDKSDYYTDVRIDERDYSNIQNTVRALYNHTFGGGHILTAGGDAMTDYLMTYQFEADGSHSQVTADVFAQFDWRITREVSLVGGARIDYFSKVNKPRLSPKLSFMYKPGDFALRASYGGGFRAPTLKELYMDFNMNNMFRIYGNPDLKSQYSHNFMLSGEYTRRRWSATLSGFYNSIDNRISTIWNPQRNGLLYINTGHVNVAGVDANLALKLSCGFGARLSYAFTREYGAKGEVTTVEVRPHTAVVRFDYGRNWKNYGFNVSLSGRYMSVLRTQELDNYTSVTYTDVRFPAYTLWKLILTQDIGKAFSVTATVDNLFNYKTGLYRYNSPTVYGTVFSVGISINIEEFFRKNR